MPAIRRPLTAVGMPASELYAGSGEGRRTSLPSYNLVALDLQMFASKRRNKAEDEVSNVFLLVDNSSKSRRRDSVKRKRSKINIRWLKAKAPFNVSTSPIRNNDRTSNPPSPPKLNSVVKEPSHRLCLDKKIRHKETSFKNRLAMEKRSRGYSAFFRKIFVSSSKENRAPASKDNIEDVPTLDVVNQKKRVAIGAGSNLKDLQHYLGNESFRICHELCRLPDHTEDKSFYALSSRVGSLSFNIRQFNTDEAPHVLMLPITVFGDHANEAEKEMMKLFMENFVSMLPNGTERISRKANPASLVCRLLPAPVIPASARFLGAAFWLWLCAIDDQIEQLNQADFEKAIDEIKCVFNDDVPSDPESSVAQTSFALRDLVKQTDLSPPSCDESEVFGSGWRQCFLDAIMEILYAFEDERPLLDKFNSGEQVKLTEWMVLRMVTISARPFMVLARASLGLQPSLSSVGNTTKIKNGARTPHRHGRSDSAQTFTPDLEWEDDISKLELLAQCAMGLQNDILGWEKDHAEKNILNSVEILFQAYQHRQTAMREMVLIHNYVVNQACLQADVLVSKYSPPERTSTVSPTRTLFRQESNIRSPYSPPPMINSPISPAQAIPFSPITPKHSEGNVLKKIKSIMLRDDDDNDESLTKNAVYVNILLGFIQGMAVWTSKAKRYAV